VGGPLRIRDATTCGRTRALVSRRGGASEPPEESGASSGDRCLCGRIRSVRRTSSSEERRRPIRSQEGAGVVAQRVLADLGDLDPGGGTAGA
jgi:hypothetical protein